MEMNTTTPQVDLNLDRPDTAIMKNASSAIQSQSTLLKFDFLPVIAEKLRHLANQASTAEKVFKEELSGVLVRLGNADLTIYDEKQKKFDDDTRLTSEQKAQATALIDGQRRRTVTEVIGTLREAARNVAQSSDDLNQVNLRLPDDHAKDNLIRQRDELSKRDETLNTQMKALIEERRVLDATIKAMEKHNVADEIIEFLPTGAELAALLKGEPDVQLFQAAMDRVAKVLGKVSSALTYRDLTEERDKLKTQLDELVTQSRATNSELQEITLNLGELTGLDSLEQSKAAWVREAQKVSESLRAFLDAHDDEALMSSVFSQNLNALEKWIETFHTIHRTV
jgi:chaperonin cofactor prefoldin